MQAFLTEAPKLVWENYSFKFGISTNQNQMDMNISATPIKKNKSLALQ